MSPWLRLLPLVALWTIPVVAVAVAVPAAVVREEASVAPPLPSAVTVGSQSTDYRTSVSVSVAMDQAGQVRSPASGLVTAVADLDGPVRPGDELFAIDGIPVLAQPGTVPFHRELRSGDVGPDVEVLGRLLVDAGLLEQQLADDTFGRGVRAGVVRLQERLGVRADGVFRPSYVAYVPASAGSLGEPLVTVGSTVAAGDPVLDTAPVPIQVRFTPTSTSATLTALKGAPLVLAFGDLQLPVSSLEPGPDELAELYTGLGDAVATGEAQDTSAGAQEGSGSLETYDGGLLSLAESQVRGMVPGTAVYITSSGAQCVFRQQDGGGWGPVPLPNLEPAVGTLGAVYVDPELIDARVARDALTLADDVRAECR